MNKNSLKPMRMHMGPKEFWSFQESLGFKDHIDDDEKHIKVYNATGKLVTEYDKVRHIIKIY